MTAATPLERVSKFLFVIMLAGFLAVLLICFSKRIFYPFELEWMEGDSLCSALRFAQGKPIYIDPAGDFVSFLYPPLYYWIIGLFIPIFGPHLSIGRVIAVLSFFTICFFIYRIVFRQTGDRMISLTSALFLPACYKPVGFWFDVVRADSLLLVLSLGGLFFLDKNIKKVGFWISMILFVLAFFTKQTAVFFIAAAILILWRQERRAALYFSFLLLGIVGGLLLMLNYFSNGWYWFYTFRVPSFHKTDFVRGFGGGLSYIFYNLPIVCTIILAGLFFTDKGDKTQKGLAPWLIVLPFAFIATALPYGKIGGYINNFYTVFIYIFILFGVMLKRVIENANKYHHIICSAIWIALVFQTYLLVYNPIRCIPKESDLEAGRKFLEEVSQIKGEVYITDHGFYGVMAEKKMYPKQFAILDVKLAFPEIEVVKQLRGKISQQEFKAIYTDRLLEKNIHDSIDQLIVNHYQVEKILDFSPENAFEQFTGYRSRPNVKYIPKRNTSEVKESPLMDLPRS